MCLHNILFLIVTTAIVIAQEVIHQITRALTFLTCHERKAWTINRKADDRVCCFYTDEHEDDNCVYAYCGGHFR